MITKSMIQAACLLESRWLFGTLLSPGASLIFAYGKGFSTMLSCSRISAFGSTANTMQKQLGLTAPTFYRRVKEFEEAIV